MSGARSPLHSATALSEPLGSFLFFFLLKQSDAPSPVVDSSDLALPLLQLKMAPIAFSLEA